MFHSMAKDGVLTVKVPVEWLDALDRLGDPEEEIDGKRSRTVRRILRDRLIAAGLIPALAPPSPPPPRPKSGQHRAAMPRK
jgi:hypothetical protein